MWIWTGAYVYDDIEYANEMLEFCQAPHGNSDYRITRLLLWTDEDMLLGAGKQKVKNFVKKAHAAGLKVDLLTGDGHWASDALKHIPKRICDKLVVYNSIADEDEQFDGIHFDIEPHVVDTWRDEPTGRDGYNDQAQTSFVEILAYCQTELGHLGTTVAADIGHDYYHYSWELWGALMESKAADYIGIMNVSKLET